MLRINEQAFGLEKTPLIEGLKGHLPGFAIPLLQLHDRYELRAKGDTLKISSKAQDDDSLTITIGILADKSKGIRVESPFNGVESSSPLADRALRDIGDKLLVICEQTMPTGSFDTMFEMQNVTGDDPISIERRQNGRQLAKDMRALFNLGVAPSVTVGNRRRNNDAEKGQDAAVVPVLGKRPRSP